MDGKSASLEAALLQRRLARSYGLVKTKPKKKTLSQAEWSVIEAKVAGRKDDRCAICLEPFSGGALLLSCSHAFHKECLEAAENSAEIKFKFRYSAT